ncbi:MAG: glycosyltransferase family 4 protein [Candidatus Tectimicrobiota bacterium]
MRIVLDARYLRQAESGVGSYTLNLARALLEADKDLELFLLCCRHGVCQHLAESRVRELLFPFPPVSPITRRTLGLFLRRYDFDLFHAPFDMLPWGLHRPAVVTLHDINWLVNLQYNSTHPVFRLVAGSYFRSTIRASMREAQRIMTVSHATRRAIIDYAPWYASKLHVTYNGFDPTRIYALDKAMAFRKLRHLLPPGTPFVLTVGQGSPYKNHLHAVQGFLEAFAARPAYRMVLVRRFLYQDKALAALLRRPEVRARVLTLPYVTSEILNALYNAAQMVLHPSYYEGFGLPLIEAMAVGTPLVTSNVSAMPEVAGAAALLVNPADVQAIAAALQALADDAPLRAKLVAEGYKRVALFNWNQCAQDTLQVYRSVLASA